ncbi:MAG: alpha/beta hydrolase [Candidatus Nanopelagicales bacterium]
MTYSAFDAPVAGGTLRGGRWQPDGDAPAVLLVHGVTAHHGSWFAVADAASDLDLVAPDLRGRGGSRSLPGPAGMREHADDLAAVLDHLGLDRVVLVGHSMGAFVSVVMADRHPDRVERMVLVDGGLPLELPAGMSTDEVMTAVLGPAVQRLSMVFPTREAYVDYWRAHPAFSDGIGPGLAAYFDADLVEVPGGFASGVSIDRVREDTATQLDPDVLPPALERLRVPTTLLRAPRGLMDQPEGLYSPDLARSWAERLPLLDVVEVDDCNHYTIVFEPRPAALVAQTIRGTAPTTEAP